MDIKWEEDFNTNIPVVDNQLKKIHGQIIEFLGAVKTGKGELETRSVIGQLKDWQISNFSIQEKYMLENGYPKYKIHMAAHKKYIKVIEVLDNEFIEQGASKELAKKIEKTMIHFWEDHVTHYDKPLAQFLKENVENLL